MENNYLGAKQLESYRIEDLKTALEKAKKDYNSMIDIRNTKKNNINNIKRLTELIDSMDAVSKVIEKHVDKYGIVTIDNALRDEFEKEIYEKVLNKGEEINSYKKAKDNLKIVSLATNLIAFRKRTKFINDGSNIKSTNYDISHYTGYAP